MASSLQFNPMQVYPHGMRGDQMPKAVRDEWKRRYYPVMAKLVNDGIPKSFITWLIGKNFSYLIQTDMERMGLLTIKPKARSISARKSDAQACVQRYQIVQQIHEIFVSCGEAVSMPAAILEWEVRNGKRFPYNKTYFSNFFSKTEYGDDNPNRVLRNKRKK